MASIKRGRDDSPEKSLSTERSDVVSVFIPREGSKKYLLVNTDSKGWWLPTGNPTGETLKVAALRVAAEVSRLRLSVSLC